MKFFAVIGALFIAALLLSAQITDSVLGTDQISTQVVRGRVISEPFLAKHNPVTITHLRDGEVITQETVYNLTTNAGLSWAAAILGSTTTPTVNTQCNYIGVSNAAITPAVTDTTLSGEITTNGLSRAQATYTYTTGATSYTEAHTYTATASQSAQAAGMFTASSAGTMCFETTFTATALLTGDQLIINWAPSI